MAVKDIDKVLQGWVVEKGFVPDIVVIDYADILAPERKNLMGRDAVNESWAAMRRLAQERRLLVISPTQADADSYDRWIMGMRNFSEDKRKLSHVTGMLGLNQTEVEKKLMVSRLNWLVLREESHNPRRCLYVGQCPPLGRMMTCSVLQSEINRANREGDQK
jgi:replicative DNA helicase